MSLDLSKLSPKARTAYILIGRHFASPDTLAQANQTLQGLAAYAADLVPHGFAAEDAQRLLDARDALFEAGVGRAEARNGKKTTSYAYVAALSAGKLTRQSALAILAGTRRVLNEEDTPASAAAAALVDTAMAQASSGDQPETLAEQLDVLRGVLLDSAVAAAAANRGGADAAKDLEDRATALRSAAAARAGAPGTRSETEHLDLLDGIVVTLARNARKAARAAARRLGKPALTADFELTKLYAARSAAAPKAPAPGNGKGAPEATPPVS